MEEGYGNTKEAICNRYMHTCFSNERILLWDSSGQEQEMRTLLRSCSYQVKHVSTHQDMISSLNTDGHFVELILLNFHTPVERNMDILKHLSGRYDIPVIGKCLQMGAADFLVKPLQAEELSVLCRRMLIDW